MEENCPGGLFSTLMNGPNPLPARLKLELILGGDSHSLRACCAKSHASAVNPKAVQLSLFFTLTGAAGSAARVEREREVYLVEYDGVLCLLGQRLTSADVVKF
jgi:hypothetical protein